MEYIVSMDVGGTTIKSRTFTQVLTPVTAPQTYPANSDKDPRTIVRTIAEIVTSQWGQIGDPDKRLLGVGFAFPGPFDYENGISYMTGLSKYESIYAYPLGSTLIDAFRKMPKLVLASDFGVRYTNDAAAFAVGEAIAGEGQGVHRLMVLTLGTGCGSTFLEDGKIVKGRDGIPEDGMVFHMPYKDKTVDDYISRRGIHRLAVKYALPPDVDVKGWAEMKEAGALFHEFGQMLGEVIILYGRKFSPDLVILGGNIAKAYPMFETGMRSVPGMESVCVSVSANMEQSALLGAASLISRMV